MEKTVEEEPIQPDALVLFEQNKDEILRLLGQPDIGSREKLMETINSNLIQGKELEENIGNFLWPLLKDGIQRREEIDVCKHHLQDPTKTNLGGAVCYFAEKSWKLQIESAEDNKYIQELTTRQFYSCAFGSVVGFAFSSVFCCVPLMTCLSRMLR